MALQASWRDARRRIAAGVSVSSTCRRDASKSGTKHHFVQDAVTAPYNGGKDSNDREAYP